MLMVTRTGIEPMIPPWKGDVLTSWPTGHVVAAVGFEPTTNRVWTEYSSQLSYAATIKRRFDLRLNYYTPYLQKSQGVFEEKIKFGISTNLRSVFSLRIGYFYANLKIIKKIIRFGTTIL